MKPLNHTASNIKTTIKKLGGSAKRKAFLKKLPIAVTENGQTILIFPDGTRKPFTSKAIAELKHA